MNEIDIIEEYRDSIRKCDYWSQRKLIFESMMLAYGLYIALNKKGLVTKEEYDFGLLSAKELYKDQSREIQEKYDKVVADKNELEKELLEMKQKIKTEDEILKEIFKA